jgi:hypothetical protein
MSRSRIWLISTAAVLCTAVPALAYSWPALFGVPGAFGQEASQPPQVATTPTRAAYTSTRPTAVIATASSRSDPGAEECDDNARCQHLGDCLSAWQRLWDRGEYAGALGLAYSAMQTAPRSLAVQHAVVLSQIMNDLRLARPERPEAGFEEAEDCRTRCPAQAATCPLPWSVLMPAVQMPLLPPGAHVYAEGQQPLFIRHFAPPCGNSPCGNSPCEANTPCAATRCGDGVSCVKSCAVECCADEAKGCCDKCAKDCKCCCTKVDKTKSRTASHSAVPTTIVIVRDHVHVPVQVPAPHVVPLPPPPVMQPVFSYGPAFPSVAVSAPMPSCPTVSRPVPAMDQRVYQVVGETVAVVPDPDCDVATPGSHVRILQRGGMCFVSSPNFEIRCDRVQSRDGDRLVLEGNVTLVSRRHGQTMTIEAERITLNVSTDQFQIDNARGLEQTRFNVAPVGTPVGTPVATPVATPPACPPAGHYGMTSAEESNAPVQDASVARLRAWLEKRKRHAYEDSIISRSRETVSEGPSRDYVLQAISRFLAAEQKESEAVQEYNALCEEIRRGVVVNERNFSTPPAAQPAPVGYSDGYYEVPPVAAPRPR